MDSPTRSPSYFAGCMASPSWFPLQRGHSRFHFLRRDSLERSRRWRNVLKRLLKQGKNMYSSKPLSFGYDEDSYSKNFDDGLWNEPSDRIGSVLQEPIAASKSVRLLLCYLADQDLSLSVDRGKKIDPLNIASCTVIPLYHGR